MKNLPRWVNFPVGLQFATVLIVVLLLISGCGKVLDGEQNKQGLDSWDLVMCKDGKTPCEVRVTVGRDKSRVKVKLETPGGFKFEYSATDATGLNQAAIRAQVELAFIEANVKVAGEVLDAVSNKLTGAVSGSF